MAAAFSAINEVLAVEQPQVTCKFKQILHLGCGAEREVQESMVVTGARPDTALNEVARNRHGCPSKLALKTETLCRWKVRRQSVDIEHHLMGDVEHTELLVIASHALRRSNSTAKDVIRHRLLQAWSL